MKSTEEGGSTGRVMDIHSCYLVPAASAQAKLESREPDRRKSFIQSSKGSATQGNCQSLKITIINESQPPSPKDTVRILQAK